MLVNNFSLHCTPYSWGSSPEPASLLLFSCHGCSDNVAAYMRGVITP